MSVISQVSTIEGCPLSGVPLYTVLMPNPEGYKALQWYI